MIDPEDIFKNELERLFQKAKETDEFEYICGLLNFKGIGDARALSHLNESFELLMQITELIPKQNTIQDQLRLLLLLYCHIFEMDEFYNIIGNMIRITQGERSAIMLYNSPTISPDLKPTNKIDKLKSIAKKAGFKDLTDVIAKLYSSPLRNSFFHSSYSLTNKDYYIVSGTGFNIEGLITKSASLKEYILPITYSTVNIAGIFFNTLTSSRLDYKNNKIITGRLQPGGVEIEILGDPDYGLRGFRSLYN